MAAASAVGTALALYGYLAPHTGIDHTEGALLVVVSSALILLASLVLAVFSSAPRWLRGIVLALLLLGILGTGCAAYFLESYALLGLMALALFGWLIHMMNGPSGGRTRSGTLRAGVA